VRDRAPTVGDPTHAAPDQEPIDRSVTRAVRDRAPTVGDPTHAALDQEPIDRLATSRRAGTRALTVGRPDSRRAGPGAGRPFWRLAPWTERRSWRLRLSARRADWRSRRAVILAAAIPARRGLPPDPDGLLRAVDVLSLVPGAREPGAHRARTEAPHGRTSPDPRFATPEPHIEEFDSHVEEFDAPVGDADAPVGGGPMPPMLLAAIPIHNSVSLALLEKGRILTSKCPRLIAQNPGRVGPGPAPRRGGASRGADAEGERLPKSVYHAQGSRSRREAEDWIRAGRITINGQPAVLGSRVSSSDQLRLDGRLIRQPRDGWEGLPHSLSTVSPGESLTQPKRGKTQLEGGGRPGRSADRTLAHPPQARRFITISPHAARGRWPGTGYFPTASSA